ncbi:MAG: hypothetical protein H6598_03005 [Flavobacteriales bacterium]|nr:hypothetical protein [Flavobacteriales bacterium]
MIATTTISINSCKKGCTDPIANNYNEEAKKDNGSCDYSDIYAEDKNAIIENYADIVFANYEDAYNEAVELQSQIAAFIANPSDNGLTLCKNAWLDAREPYGQTEVYRFADGPIDDADGPEGLLNAWPLDESYIDYVTGNANAGIINDPTTYPTIDAATLEGLNEAGGEENISVGYHAIEFLLWGQDDPNTALLTPGQRSYLDYVDGGGTASNEDRRRTYLMICADLLVAHLGDVKDEWDPAISGNFRSTFLSMDNDAALANILTGMGTLSKSELAGERMFVALDNQDQEDEHSCFSDNTHRDIITNAQGIRNVFIGSYTRVNGTTISGTSLQDLIEKINPDRESTISTFSASIVTLTNDIPTPFDYHLTQETAGGNGPVMQAINALQDQGDAIVQMAKDMGITISTAL